MHILNVMQCTNLGGMEQTSLRLMAELQKRGHSLEVLSVHPIGALGSKLAAHGIPARGLDYAGHFGWRSHLRLRRAVRAVNAGAILMTGPTLTGILALGRGQFPPRVLAVHFHHEGVKPSWAWRSMYRLVLRRFGAVTFPSNFVREEAARLLPAVGRISCTVPNPLGPPPMPTAEERAAARAALGLASGAAVVGNAGWLIPRKRFDVFLRVAGRIEQAIPGVTFLIAGDGEERSRLRALARELGIAEQVRWLGWQEDLTHFYRSLDVLLFNAEWDAAPVTPHEAMAHGIPVVASVVHGGLREVITDERFGFLNDAHDLGWLADRVVMLLRDPARARALGSSGRARLGEISSPARIAATYEQLLLGAPAADRNVQAGTERNNGAVS